MTLVLAIETATVNVATALADESGVLGESSCRAGRGHAERLHLMIESVLTMAGRQLSDVTAIAVDTGPGLFTGIRVGVAAAKGLAFALELPVVALSNLEVLVRAASGGVTSQAGDGSVVGVVDIRRGEVAWLWSGDRSSGISHGGPQVLNSLLVAKPAVGRVLLAGDGAVRYADILLGGLPNGVVAPSELACAPVASLAMLAVERVLADEVTGAAAVAPVYLRDADVRIKWTTRHDSPRQDLSRHETAGE